jgi:hypothetical protein
VELAAASEPDALVEVVAAALDVPERQGQTRAQSVAEFLRAKRLLVVLDNCEHLLDAVAGFVEGVVSSCPQVRVLATSREGLGVAGERILVVPSLGLPDGDEAGAEAMQLFVERAAEAKEGFALTPSYLPRLIEGDAAGAAAVVDEALAVARRRANPTARCYTALAAGASRVDARPTRRWYCSPRPSKPASRSATSSGSGSASR